MKWSLRLVAVSFSALLVAWLYWDLRRSADAHSACAARGGMLIGDALRSGCVVPARVDAERGATGGSQSILGWTSADG